MDNQFEEISLSEILYILAKRWWAVFIITGVCIAFAAVYTFFFLEPIYQADTSLYIGKRMDSQNSIAYNDLIIGERLANDYREIVKSRFITGLVIEKLDLALSSKELAQKISVQSKKDTRLINIFVEDKSPARAMEIADAVAETFKEKVLDIIDEEHVQIIDKAILPQNPIKPNKKVNIAISFVLGVMLGCFVVFAFEYFDKTIKSVDELKRYVDLPVIGVIPKFEE